MNTHTLIIEVNTDEKNLPEEIGWKSSDMPAMHKAKAAMVALWDTVEQQTVRLDVWTKDMTVEDMKIFFHQTMVQTTHAFLKSTGDELTTRRTLDFLEKLGTEMGILKKET